ncbi:hypothetical protein V495_01158 [Pseudogymnoascus sp. VKM F-4514 (FW-929)]|nr:hypothetical protein V495_01158 [Pseudogymnoascus sp. VKM F-4514 (FW-929)]KFY67178.1 hypothetical protein V497_00518 [Pseudogymnoascus sp. VKM F-4516 (FW-969)]
MTQIQPVNGKSNIIASEENSNLSSRLPPGFLDEIPKLDKLQAGHLRHFHNLSTQLDGEWRHMGTQEPAQEWLDALRYQLATMTYAAGAAHYHHLPGLQSTFKGLFKRLIKKMLRREVWGYWYLTSQSGKFVDPDITELRKPWADPVKTENIMYSGHLLLMISLFAMLFDDDTFEKKSSLVFNWNPVFFGMGPESFVYSRETLQVAIIDEMEKNGWKGVCCEPNCVFVVCNQFPLIAMRYNDNRNGTNVVDEVLPKYKKAWAGGSMFGSNGLIVDWYRVNQRNMAQPMSLGFTAWAGAFMNTWNSVEVRSTFRSQALGFLTLNKLGDVNLNPVPVAHTIRRLVAEQGADPDASETLRQAREIVASSGPARRPPFAQPALGYVVQWLSELGKKELLSGLLKHADTFLKPSWENGGLYYPRCDQPVDGSGNSTLMDPYTGNAAIGYARLNIEDGQKKMWEKPWTGEFVRRKPFVDTTAFEEGGVDFLRAGWHEESSAFIVTTKTWHGRNSSAELSFENLPLGVYGVYIDGELRRTALINEKNQVISESVEIGGKEKDIVVLKCCA